MGIWMDDVSASTSPTSSSAVGDDGVDVMVMVMDLMAGRVREVGAGLQGSPSFPLAQDKTALPDQWRRRKSEANYFSIESHTPQQLDMKSGRDCEVFCLVWLISW